MQTKIKQRKKIKNYGIVLLLGIVLIIPAIVKAAAYTGQETTATLINSAVGRYQLNYTGSTNHYASWNTEGEPLGNVIYNDIGGYSNSSTATLTPSTGANKIIKAYLVWETRAPEGATNPIVFISPKGGQWIYPTYAINDWRDSGNGSWAYSTMYCMAADVTAVVRDAGYGNYTVANIPRWVPTSTDSSGKYPGGESPGSWQLIIVEEGDFPVRSIYLSMGADFYMAKDFGLTMQLNSNLQSKSMGSTTGQIFFGASNSSSNAAMTENTTTYNSNGGIIKGVGSNTTYSPGLYRNGKLVNGRDSANGYFL